MPDASAPIVVAGHICLDVIPALAATDGDLASLLAPGTLVEVGPPVLATGGAVSNVGLTLHRLGWPVRLMGKVGDDLFGQAVLDHLRRAAPALTDGMLIAEGEASSYTIVLNPPGTDRTFLHCPGANDTFAPAEIDRSQAASGAIFHFGYPPLMQQTYADGGAALADLFADLRDRGVFVSLDMAMPDPQSASGRVDWGAWLARVLPHVDLFGPSLDEICFMLDRSPDTADGRLLYTLAEDLLTLGARLVALKLGDQGLYLHTVDEPDRLPARLDARWAGRNLLAPCFRVEVAGTTGAGDTTHAGLLAAIASGLTPEAALTSAVAVGACSVEAADATGGVPSWNAVQARIQTGWARRPITLTLPDWSQDAATGLYHAPSDSLTSTLP